MAKFNDWVTEMYLKFADERMKGKCDVSHFSDNAITLCYDKKKNKVGIARKHPEDIYDYRTGVAIAYARCKGYEIPKQTVYKKLSEMKYGDKFKHITNDIFIFVGKNPIINNQFIYIRCCNTEIINNIDCGQEYEMVD